MRYKHDCNKCIFLGEFSSDGQNYDLYFCNGRGTIVARYGNDGPDYSSGLILTSETLAKGLCLAIEAKLINFNRDFHVFETLSEVVCFNVGYLDEDFNHHYCCNDD